MPRVGDGVGVTVGGDVGYGVGDGFGVPVAPGCDGEVGMGDFPVCVAGPKVLAPGDDGDVGECEEGEALLVEDALAAVAVLLALAVAVADP